MQKILLVQPKYPFGKSQLYLSGGLLSLGSRLLKVGFDVDFIDMNLDADFHKDLNKYAYICITIVGTPYIPVAIEYVQKIRMRGIKSTILIGGQGIARMSRADFKKIFPFQNVRKYHEGKVRTEHGYVIASNLNEIFDKSEPLPCEYKTSILPMLRKIPTEKLAKLLKSEFCLFVSQGCKYNCKFCQAAKNTPERFRQIEPIREEVEFICKFLMEHKHGTIDIYLSNLDILQNPAAMEERLYMLYSICSKYGITLRMRGLATAKSAVQALKADKDILNRWSTYGLHTIGYGADGATKRIWIQQNKRHNSITSLEQAISATQRAGMTVELLMVSGFKNSRLLDHISALAFSLTNAIKGSHIRPYVAKTNWNLDGDLDEDFLNNPELLLYLDYAMLASKYTHPSRVNRALTNLTFLTLTLGLKPFGLSPSWPLFPPPPKGKLRQIIQAINRCMPFDK